MTNRTDPHAAMDDGLDAGRKANLDAPENGYTQCGKTALALAISRGYKGHKAQAFAQGYLISIGQLVRVQSY